MEFLWILLFALAVSADGFMAGVAYGVSQIRIPITSKLVIALASALAVTVSMVCGKGLSTVLPPAWTSIISATLLTAIGLFFLLRACREKINGIVKSDKEPLIAFSIKSLGIIVYILKEPSRADFDSSGIISTREAFFLGIALALDALGAGIGIAMAGFNILFTALSVGMLKFILIHSGFWAGKMVSSQKLKALSSLIPGIIFIMLGIFEYL